ncbi:hypothetical protein Pelo_16232 [Pelomyxa schiedti]|nr:hypothetical protein Pelo_16232 [Pelomyxa schiedti]
MQALLGQNTVGWFVRDMLRVAPVDPLDVVSLLEALGAEAALESQLLARHVRLPRHVDSHSPAADRDRLAEVLAQCVCRGWRRAVRWVVQAAPCLRPREQPAGPPGITGRWILRQVLSACAGAQDWDVLRGLIVGSRLERADMEYGGNILLASALRYGNVELAEWMHRQFGFSRREFVESSETVCPRSIEWFLSHKWPDPVLPGDNLWIRLLINSIRSGHSSADIIRIINKCPTEGDSSLIGDLIVTATECSRRDILEHLLERLVHWEYSATSKWATLICEKKWYDLLLAVLSRIEPRDPESHQCEMQTCVETFCDDHQIEIWVSNFHITARYIDIEPLVRSIIRNRGILNRLPRFGVQNSDMSRFFFPDFQMRGRQLGFAALIDLPFDVVRYLVDMCQVPMAPYLMWLPRGTMLDNWRLYGAAYTRLDTPVFVEKVIWYAHASHHCSCTSMSVAMSVLQWIPLANLAQILGNAAAVRMRELPENEVCESCVQLWARFNEARCAPSAGYIGKETGPVSPVTIPCVITSVFQVVSPSLITSRYSSRTTSELPLLFGVATPARSQPQSLKFYISDCLAFQAEKMQMIIEHPPMVKPYFTEVCKANCHWLYYCSYGLIPVTQTDRQVQENMVDSDISDYTSSMVAHHMFVLSVHPQIKREPTEPTLLKVGYQMDSHAFCIKCIPKPGYADSRTLYYGNIVENTTTGLVFTLEPLVRHCMCMIIIISALACAL